MDKGWTREHFRPDAQLAQVFFSAVERKFREEVKHDEYHSKLYETFSDFK